MEKTTYVPVDKWLLYSDSYNNVSQAGGSPTNITRIGGVSATS